jgi:hypothetical protein
VPSCCGESCSCHDSLYVLNDDVYISEGWDVGYAPQFSTMGCCCSGPYYFSADNLPDGLSIDPQTGAITGTLGYDFADQANSPVTLSSTIRLHQHDLCTGETIEATGTIYWHIYDNNRLPTASSFSLENLTDSSRSSSPRTKDKLRFTVSQVSDPDGDPVRVTIEWQVNGQTVQTTSGTESSFDLSVPGHGDVGDTITVIVKLNDGSGDFEVYSTTVTVDNTPPVVTSIIVEGAQAFEDGVYYFLVGQHAVITVYAQDDDLDPGQGNDDLWLDIQGEMPPTQDGWHISGYDRQTGKFVVEGIIGDHGDPYEPTKYYDLNICARDNSGVGDPPILLAVTRPGVPSVLVVPPAGLLGSGTAADPYLLSASGGPVTFEVVISGVGFGGGIPWAGVIWWRLYDSDPWPNPDDLLQDDTREVPTLVGGPLRARGAWEVRTTVTLTPDPASDEIHGRDGSTGGGIGEGPVKELYFYIWWYTGIVSSEAHSSPIFYVKWVP